MKLFGKKALALFMALAMMMSVCVFATETEAAKVVEVKLEENAKAEMNVAYGDTNAGVTGTKVVLVYEGDKEPETVSATWTPDKKFDSTELGAIYTYTAKVDGVADDVEMPTIKVTVVPAVITGITYSPASPMQVPLGATERAVKNALPEAATVKLQDGRTLTWSIGSGKSDLLAKWNGAYDEDNDEAEIYEYTTELQNGAEKNYVVTSEASLIFKVEAADEISADVAVTLKYTGEDEEEFDLADMVVAELEDQFTSFDMEIDEIEIDEVTGTYGEVDKYGNYAMELSTLEVKKIEGGSKLTEKKIGYEAKDENGVKYEGKIAITIISAVKDFDYEMEEGEFSFDFGTWLAGKLADAMNEDLDYVTFSVEEDEGGVLYADEEGTEVDEDEKYYLDADDDDGEYALKDMVFIPDGTEADFEIEYHAFGEDDEELEGTITIECMEFLMLTADIDSLGSVDFDADDIEKLVEDSEYDDYDLDYITGLKVVGGGTLYYDYDEDAKTHPKVKSNTKYYPGDDEDALIDEITYVPTKTTEGQIIISFDVKVVKNKKSATLSAVYVINVTQRADITVQVAKNGEVALNLADFENFLDDNGGTKKNYDMTYIVFEGAPTSKGYLCEDGKKIKSPNGKKFYIEDEDDGDIAFEDVTFKGGSANAKTTAEFAIYGKKSSSSKTSTKLCSGTIDFIVGSTTVTNSLKGEINASSIMNLGNSSAMFEDLGGRSNVYIEFTSLPQYGKLYYNYGTASQADVTVGADYYMTAASGKLQLKNVSYVPSYSSSKIAKAEVINVKAYDKNGKSVNGTIEIAIKYAYKSETFTDITTSTYADSVDFLLNRKITTGMTATTFGPNEKVTRGQFVTFLYRAAGSPSVAGVQNKFVDVKATDYYYNAVLWAVKNGITNGTSATTFDPNANVNHQQLLTFLYRYDVTLLGHSGALGSTSYVYDFSSVESWAQTAVRWAVQKNIISSGYLQPADAGTRATVALWLHRMLTL